MLWHQLRATGTWPIEDGRLVSNGVTNTAKDLGCLLVKECLSLSGIQITLCLC